MFNLPHQHQEFSIMLWLFSVFALVALSHGAEARRERPVRSVSFEKYLGTVDANSTALELHIDVDDVEARNETAP
jgi:hypothetical protein